jgi:hypothetical protein
MTENSDHFPQKTFADFDTPTASRRGEKFETKFPERFGYQPLFRSA